MNPFELMKEFLETGILPEIEEINFKVNPYPNDNQMKGGEAT